jgi:hypothetical protein
MRVSLDFIVDSIERLVLSIRGNTAFELLSVLFEADGAATEICAEHDWDVACAYERAAGEMLKAAQKLPRSFIEERVKGWVEADAYGMRGVLRPVFLRT